ncbi:OPI10 family protein [Aspergillus glaucus CBS 516.65]|uniref:Uncharacterized protein n=1 Tax=Aspergillus glaucus CBS 516.65 TaxID=1160497 RepID=A0A1L9V6E7_ASPGL|nr:hypothetical protein ASPGLDRAFT_1039214 [Aspergillus glaucus CBS 516.65]OJJ79493.1 hypothetical protein ASPGLDRAFT_1039214 [Aspergillus glaucus CBS 516.65]
MFSVIIPGRPCLTNIVAVDGQPNGQPTKFAFTFPLTPSFTDVVVFFLPGTVLPQDTAAAIYIQLPEQTPSPNGPAFRFIGALANEKPSAVFKVRPGETPSTPQRSEAEDQDEMLDEGASNLSGGVSPGGMVTLGISIEPVQTVAPQLAQLEAEKPAAAGASTDLVQQIIGNAFNFLASFAAPDPNHKGEEVVTLKSFRDWWTKFERRVEMDPSFLEKEDPNAQG